MRNETTKVTMLILGLVLSGCNSADTSSSAQSGFTGILSASESASQITPVSSSSDSVTSTVSTSSTVSSDSVATVVVSASPSPSPSPSSSPSSTPVSLTVYQRTVTNFISGSRQTYTVTGYCTEIKTSTYCWDDGMKSIELKDGNYDLGLVTYTYWGASQTSAIHTEVSYSCNGGCYNDVMSSPTLIGYDFLMQKGQSYVDQVFDSGISNIVSCTELSGVITCPTFEVNTN